MSENNKKKRVHKRINNILLVLLLLTTVLMIAAFGWNIYKIIAKDSEEEKVQTAEVEKPDNEFINDYYTIGHNATEINKEYFRELNSALESGEQASIAQAVTKCFVTEYYTWTNKDGNYDVGGMQYIYSDERSDFEKYSRYNFYNDMDLFISQIGTSQLLEVSSVTVNSCDPTEFTMEDGTVRGGYNVNVSWTLNPTPMPTDGIQSSAMFTIVDHDGRMEIAAIQ